MSANKNNSGLAAFGAGTVAGCSGTLIGHPFDSLKVRLQVGRVLAPERFDLKWVQQLYRGVLPPILTAGFTSSINFTVYESSRGFLNRHYFDQPTQTSHLSSVFFAACCSGSIVSLISNPISVVKIQQQVATEKGMFSCTRDLWKRYGLRTFYRGYSSTFVLECPGRGVYMTIYESIKTLFAYAQDTQGRSLNDRSLVTTDGTQRIVCAGIAGMIAWLPVYPFDVIKARMQLDSGGKIYRSTLHCAELTWREGGLRSMYRGLLYTLIRAFPVAGAVLPIYESTRDFLGERMVGEVFE